MAQQTLSPAAVTRSAKAPFLFNSSAHLIRIGRERAATLGEFAQALATCPDDSIFQHTFQTLQEHHYIREGFSNDFAHWAYAACNEVELAERLASVDIREFTSIKALRARLVSTVEEYLKRNPRAVERTAFEPFYFCASDTVVIPTNHQARNLAEFADALKNVGLHSIHYHFIQARIRLGLDTNDFSIWLDRQMEMPDLADKLEGIDIYTSTLNDVRKRILEIVQRAAGQSQRAA